MGKFFVLVGLCLLFCGEGLGDAKRVGMVRITIVGASSVIATAESTPVGFLFPAGTYDVQDLYSWYIIGQPAGFVVTDYPSIVAGSTVVTDLSGKPIIGPPPLITQSAMTGFIAGITVLGFGMLLRWFVRGFFPMIKNAD